MIGTKKNIKFREKWYSLPLTLAYTLAYALALFPVLALALKLFSTP